MQNVERATRQIIEYIIRGARDAFTEVEAAVHSSQCQEDTRWGSGNEKEEGRKIQPKDVNSGEREKEP